MNTPLSSALAGERIAVVDVLRAFALFGIIVTHSIDGFLAGQPPSDHFMQFGAADSIVVELQRLFTLGKFYTIFSFLFGLSFAIQLRNAEQKGAGFAGRFAWRLIVLALIALVHGALFTGDILIVYAFLGLLLIPFRNRKTKTLLIIATILAFNIPGMIFGAAFLAVPPPTPEQVQANAALQTQFAQMAQQALAIKQSGTLSELARSNLTFGILTKLAYVVFTGRLWVTFGLFLLGVCAGRLEIFRDTEANRTFFRKLLWPAGLLSAVTTLAVWLYPLGQQMQSAMNLLQWFASSVQQIALSTFYVAVVTLLFWRRPLQGLLPKLAPLGRMGLTSYIGQSVFGILLFYGLGFGLLGKIGAAAAVGAAIAFFVLQIVLANVWSRWFRMGPAEWIWRSLTYFTLQPNRRSEAVAAS
jgi:uncharacterized protein